MRNRVKNNCAYNCEEPILFWAFIDNEKNIRNPENYNPLCIADAAEHNASIPAWHQPQWGVADDRMWELTSASSWAWKWVSFHLLAQDLILLSHVRKTHLACSESALWTPESALWRKTRVFKYPAEMTSQVCAKLCSRRVIFTRVRSALKRLSSPRAKVHPLRNLFVPLESPKMSHSCEERFEALKWHHYGCPACLINVPLPTSGRNQHSTQCPESLIPSWGSFFGFWRGLREWGVVYGSIIGSRILLRICLLQQNRCPVHSRTVLDVRSTRSARLYVHFR